MRSFADAEDDPLAVLFRDPCGPQADRDSFSVHEHTVPMNEDALLLNFAQNVFLREDPQMPFHILRRDRPGRVKDDIAEEILSLSRQTIARKFGGRVVLCIPAGRRIDRIKNDVIRRERGDSSQKNLFLPKDTSRYA